jgi:hypothetical protein
MTICWHSPWFTTIFYWSPGLAPELSYLIKNDHLLAFTISRGTHPKNCIPAIFSYNADHHLLTTLSPPTRSLQSPPFWILNSFAPSLTNSEPHYESNITLDNGWLSLDLTKLVQQQPVIYSGIVVSLALHSGWKLEPEQHEAQHWPSSPIFLPLSELLR